MAQRMDLSFTMNHIGANTESVIESKGALDGNAKKVFRGNLQFEQGAAKSVGRERETVMLLDERVHAESIPALLCAEDDVIGEHAASIGRVDQQKLFYLMSRGLTMAAAKKLVVKAAFEEVLAEAATVNLRDEIEALIDRRLS
jgi:Fe-S cluster assembly scaffold protein SufB